MAETDPGSEAQGPTTPVDADVTDGVGRDWWTRFVDWATLPAPRPERRPGTRVDPVGGRVARVVAGLLSMVMIAGSVGFAMFPGTVGGLPQPWTRPSPPSPAQVADDIAVRADALGRGDPLAVLQLRLAAYTVDRTSARHRAALAQLLLGPRPLATIAASVGQVTRLGFDGSDRLAIGGHDGVQEASGSGTTLALGAAAGGDLSDVSAVVYRAGELWAATGSGVRPVVAPGGSALTVHALAPLGSTGWAATTRDGRLVTWDAARTDDPPSRVLAEGLGPAAPLTATPDGRFLYTGEPGGLAVRDAVAGQITATIEVPGTVSAISVDGTGSRMLVGHGDHATVFDLTKPSAPEPGPTLSHPGGTVSAAVLAPDGQTAVTSGVGATNVWHLATTGEPTTVATLPIGSAPALAYSADSATLATATGATVHTWSIAELLAYRPAQVQAMPTLQSQLPAEVAFAAFNSDGSYLLTSGPQTPGSLWHIRRRDNNLPVLEHHTTLDSPARTASLAGNLTRTTVITVDYTGQATRWMVSDLAAFRSGQLTATAESAAVAPDQTFAVTVTGTQGTAWELVVVHKAEGTLSYPSPITAMAFASQSPTLIAGHSDGMATVHTIDLRRSHASRRQLTGASDGPIDAVALSGDATVALAAHVNGAVTVWNLNAPGADAGIPLTAKVGAGPHSVWLSANGDFAMLSDAHATTTLWSLVDPTTPTMLATVIGGQATLPATLSADGSTAAHIREDRLTVWDLLPVIGLAEEPTVRACQLAQLTHERWREIMPDLDLNAPCLPPPIPALDSTSSAGAPAPPSTGQSDAPR